MSRNLSLVISQESKSAKFEKMEYRKLERELFKAKDYEVKLEEEQNRLESFVNLIMKQLEDLDQVGVSLNRTAGRAIRIFEEQMEALELDLRDARGVVKVIQKEMEIHQARFMKAQLKVEAAKTEKALLWK